MVKQDGFFSRTTAALGENFGLGRRAALAITIVAGLMIVFACWWFFHSAPPKTIIITSGDKASLYHAVAEKYARILARDGVKLVILPSAGAVENLRRLADPSFQVDIGFVQAGLDLGVNSDNLVSLGSVSYQPLLVFHRLPRAVTRLSQLAGKRLAVGREGSGTRLLAMKLLAMNGIEPGGSTEFLAWEGEEAAAVLLKGELDAVFFMADAASSGTMRSLLQAPGIGLADFTQADGYIRRIGYLHKLTMPRGAMNFGKDIPARDITLIGPTVELVARKNLHPALSDLLLAAAMEIHGRPALFQNRGEFPAALENELPISDDAKRYYKSGKTFLYRYLPFWLASLINRILVVFVPLVIILIPGLKSIPALFHWRMKLRINRWYRQLLQVEQDALRRLDAGERDPLGRRIDAIEAEVHKMKVPAAYGDQFYVLRTHISFVRGKLGNTRSD
ncbi:MAG TPA: TAXI family TRAP transporter solute-binding subunit [Syntrophales bacterium]|nr:TAXI family TRAP transporter solute-binding subunit [Syntrophales bacterium]HOH74022.1 TAXI family TRAP transporter solute-binding subunit [Syntrophales bacterium]HPN07986.1 TAXI family TRAP transporter solute-binding subunit [Syntrophales bacterium]